MNIGLVYKTPLDFWLRDDINTGLVYKTPLHFLYNRPYYLDTTGFIF